MPAEDTYPFEEDYQVKIASLILRDQSFLKQYSDTINPKFFDYNHLGSLVRIGVNLFEKYKQIPTKETLLEKVKDFCVSYKISENERNDILAKVDDLYQVDLTDSEIVKESVIGFGQHQALKSAVLQLVDLVNSQENYDQSREIIDNALKVGTNCLDLGLDFYRELELGNVQSIIEQVIGKDGLIRKIPTGFSILDHNTMGGPGRGEVWVVMGLPAVGKSQFLLNLAISALEAGNSVVYITIGDLKEEDVFVRCASRLTLCPVIDVLNMTQSFMRRIDKIKKYTERRLRIKYYPANTATPETVRAYLSKLAVMEGIRPQLLIIDYPDEFKPYCDDLYVNAGRQYSEMNAIAAEFDLLVWVASQVTRADLKDPDALLRMTNIADSWRKAMKADGIVSLNQKVAEYNNGKARLWCDKVRRGSRYFKIDLDTDYSVSSIQQSQKQEGPADEEEEANTKK